MIDQTIQGLQSHNPSIFSDFALLFALVSGYLFIAYKHLFIPQIKSRPVSNDPNRTLWQRIVAFGAASKHPLTAEEMLSVEQCRRNALPVIVLYCVLLGFFASTFGMVWMMWAWIATVVGILFRTWIDSRTQE